jgi:hypothetical protein
MQCAHCASMLLQVVRSFAKGPVEALQIAATEFGRLANQITTGAASRMSCAMQSLKVYN